MNFRVLYTHHFGVGAKRLSKKYPSFKSDLDGLISILETDPFQGQFLGHECYKIRMAIRSKGKGKSGGARIIIHVFVEGATVFLLSVYDKSSQENVSDKEILHLLRQIKN